MLLQLEQKVKQGFEVDIALAGADQVVHHQRHVLQVAVLAVAVIQAREDAQYLDVALQADQVEPAQELLRGITGEGAPRAT